MLVDNIRVFVPSKNYKESQQFYQALGFKMDYVLEDLSLFENGECTFFLQDFYNEGLCENFMLQLIVKDINQAYKVISNIEITGVRYEAIKEERWGKVIYLWGPSGELLHVTELAS